MSFRVRSRTINTSVYKDNAVSSATGPVGRTGPTGNVGPVGPIGATGVIGNVGPQGIQGVIGNTGLQGIRGFTGFVGNVGPAGIQGEQGIRGFTGTIGPTGVIGAQGLVGPSGGPTGPTGTVGPAGTLGTLLTTSNNFSALQSFNKISLNDTIIILRGSSDENHMLRYSSAANGFQLMGFSGGILGTPVEQNMIQLSNVTGITMNSATTTTRPLTIGTSGTSCNSMKFGSFVGVSNATQTVVFTTPFTTLIIPKIILTVVDAGVTFPTGNAFVTNESLTGFSYNFSYINSSNTFVHAANGVKINWMALQGS